MQVRSDYEQLRQTCAAVSRERDVAQQQRSRLQGRVENLEQVLKVRHLRLYCTLFYLFHLQKTLGFLF